MSKLYDMRQQVEKIITDQNLDPFKIRGTIGLKAGILFGSIKQDTPDENDKIDKLRAAVKEVLNVQI